MNSHEKCMGNPKNLKLLKINSSKFTRGLEPLYGDACSAKSLEVLTLVFSTDCSPIDWLQSALKIARFENIFLFFLFFENQASRSWGVKLDQYGALVEAAAQNQSYGRKNYFVQPTIRPHRNFLAIGFLPHVRDMLQLHVEPRNALQGARPDVFLTRTSRVNLDAFIFSTKFIKYKYSHVQQVPGGITDVLRPVLELLCSWLRAKQLHIKINYLYFLTGSLV